MNWSVVWIAGGIYLLVDTLRDFRHGKATSKYGKVVKRTEDPQQFKILVVFNVALAFAALLLGFSRRHDPRWQWTDQPTVAAAITVIESELGRMVTTLRTNPSSVVGIIALAAVIIYRIFWARGRDQRPTT